MLPGPELLRSHAQVLRSQTGLLRSRAQVLPRSAELLCPGPHVLPRGTDLLLPRAEAKLPFQALGLRKTQEQEDLRLDGLLSRRLS